MFSRTLTLLLIAAIVAAACKKKTEPPNPPSIEGANFYFLEPADSLYIETGTEVVLNARLESNLSDYTGFTAALGIIAPDGTRSFKGATISSEGRTEAVFNTSVSPGLYRFFFEVTNPFNAGQYVLSSEKALFIGMPPAVQITTLTNDDTSITINWSNASVSDFEAYEVYVTRWDQLPFSGPAPDGQPIARITDPGVHSFKHDSVYFHYRYTYIVKLVTQEGNSSASERRQIDAGTSLYLGDTYPTRAIVYDRKRTKMYVPYGALKIIDPQAMVVEDSLAAPGGSNLVYITMNPSGDVLDGVISNDNKNFQVVNLNLNSKVFSLGPQFTLPNFINEVKGLIDDFVIYGIFMNNKPYTVAQNVFTGDTMLLSNMFPNHARAISNSRLIVSGHTDSLFVYQLENGNFNFLTKMYSLYSSPYNGLGVFEGNGYIVAGIDLFDQSFNKLGSIDPGIGDNANFFLGITDDGTFAATANNEVLSIPSLQVVRKYGDGFGTVTYFSSDNNTMFHFTEGNFNVRWSPPSRLFRYPWR